MKQDKRTRLQTKVAVQQAPFAGCGLYFGNHVWNEVHDQIWIEVYRQIESQVCKQVQMQIQENRQNETR